MTARRMLVLIPGAPGTGTWRVIANGDDIEIPGDSVFLIGENGAKVLSLIATAAADNWIEINSQSGGANARILAKTSSGSNAGLTIITAGTGLLLWKRGSGSAIELVDLSTAQTLSGKTLDSSCVVSLAALPAAMIASDSLWDAKGDLVLGTAANTAAKLTVGPDGYRLEADSAQTQGAAWTRAFQDILGECQVGSSPWDVRYIAGATVGVTLPTGVAVANTLYALEYVAGASVLDRLGIEITAGVAGNCRIGLWNRTSPTNKYPSSKILDTGNISTSSAVLAEATISQAVTPGKRYWLSVCFDAAPTFRCMSNNQTPTSLGWPNTGLGAGAYWGCTVAFTYAALPSTFPAGAALVAAGPRPAIFRRYSA